MGWDSVGRGRLARTRHKFVSSPHELLSREQGAVTKDWGGRMAVAVVYPNSYFIGMSNLGIHTLYRLLNGCPNIVAERVFWEGAEESQGPAPLSLESRRPLADFAVVALSISYELDYFNVVRILKASGIPLYATERDERHPLLIAGGACITANPMPLSPFFDCLCIGEAEPLLPGLLSLLGDSSGEKREKLRPLLAALPGVYMPQCHSGAPVVRQWARNLDDFPVASVVLTPDTELGDLYLIEVERGCNWGCRFCLVGSAFCPLRYRSLDRLIAQAELGLKYRMRLGLVGPVVSDHPRIEELLSRLRKMGAGLSTSSLRVKPLSRTVISELAKGGVKTLAIAPEAGSERLRQLIGKDISEDDILQAVAIIAGQGIRKLKLYFMIGLPTETDEDIEEVGRLVTRCKDVWDSQCGGGRLSLTVSPFIPKAGTPFQWLPMADITTLNRRLSLVKKRLQPVGIKVQGESAAWSQVQAVLARGDESLAGVLASVEEPTLSGWRNAAAKCRFDVDFYALERWPLEQKLPWAVVELGAARGHLESELRRALA